MERPAGAATTIDWDALDAVLFDLDGVLTPTAEIHERAWKSMFDAFLAARANGGDWEPFSADDYLAYVDGKRRVDGVRSFLASRGIVLPEGTVDDEPGHGTVNALGNAKNAAFQEVLRRDGIEPYPGVRPLPRRPRPARQRRRRGVVVAQRRRGARGRRARRSLRGRRRRQRRRRPQPARQAGTGHVPRRGRRAGRRRRQRTPSSRTPSPASPPATPVASR